MFYHHRVKYKEEQLVVSSVLKSGQILVFYNLHQQSHFLLLETLFRFFHQLKSNLAIMNIPWYDNGTDDKSIIITSCMCKTGNLFFSLSFNIIATFRIWFSNFSFFQLTFRATCKRIFTFFYSLFIDFIL